MVSNVLYDIEQEEILQAASGALHPVPEEQDEGPLENPLRIKRK